MIPLIQEQVVDKGWIGEDALSDFIAISEATPGPFALNISTFVGNTVGGAFGAVCATLGVILPSLIIIIIVVAGSPVVKSAVTSLWNRLRAGGAQKEGVS